MPYINLSERLRHIAGMIPSRSRVADIGTDHARLPIWLWQNGVCDKIIATEVREGPFSKAKRMIKHCGAEGHIELRMGNGLDPISEGETDIVVIAGMGGETIAEILGRASARGCEFASERFILQPMSGFVELRKYLYNEGFAAERESLCRDGGRIRLFIKAKRGYSPSGHVGRFYFGEDLKSDPLFSEYRKLQREHLLRAVRGLEISGSNDALLQEYRLALEYESIL